jgi:hypothetical protein
LATHLEHQLVQFFVGHTNTSADRRAAPASR